MKPKTRLENFLAKIAKDPDATIMDPKTRKEVYLDKIAQDNKCKVPEYGEEDIGRVLTVAAGESSQQTVEIVPLQTNGVLFGRSPNLENVNSSVKLTDGMTAHVKFDLWDHHPIVSVEEDVSVEYFNGNYIIEMTVDYDYDISINLTTRTVSGYYNDDHEQQHYPMGVEYSLENFVMTADVEVAETELEWKEVESSGGVFTVHVDDVVGALDKTMGEIQEAWTRGDKIDIIRIDPAGVAEHCALIGFIDVHYAAKADNYTGNVYLIPSSGGVKPYSVIEATEAAALNAYPTAGTK